MVMKWYQFLHIACPCFDKRETGFVNFVRIILLTLWVKLQYNPLHCGCLSFPSLSGLWLGHCRKDYFAWVS